MSDGVKHVYQAICDVAAELSREGITKSRKNAQQGYNFRGIDDVYNALAPFLAKHGLCILPDVLTREVTERETQRGGTLFYVVVRVNFAFVSAKDGSEHHVTTYGEAMDAADKATNKAMSAAYKYAAMQAFCIPTEGDNDADATTHDVKARTAGAPGAWKGKNVKGREYEGTGRPLPHGWFQRLKENRAAAIEEIGGQEYGAEKNPAGKWEIVRFLVSRPQPGPQPAEEPGFHFGPDDEPPPF